MDNLALPSSSTHGLFVSDSIAAGSGSAAGMVGSIRYEHGALSARASLSLSRSARWAGPMRYEASFNRPRTLAIAAGLRVAPRTDLQPSTS
jgi:hypothetical protein